MPSNAWGLVISTDKLTCCVHEVLDHGWTAVGKEEEGEERLVIPNLSSNLHEVLEEYHKTTSLPARERVWLRELDPYILFVLCTHCIHCFQYPSSSILPITNFRMYILPGLHSWTPGGRICRSACQKCGSTAPLDRATRTHEIGRFANPKIRLQTTYNH